MQEIRVLIVDDSKFFREVLSRGISAYLPKGSTIEKASNPFEARDKILSFDPDIMILDVEMPRMNGIDFLRRLVTQYDLPTIVLSARPAYRSIALEAGAYGFMSKPSTLEGVSFMKELAANIKLSHEKHQMMIKAADSSRINRGSPTRESSSQGGANKKKISLTGDMGNVMKTMQRVADTAKKLEVLTGRKRVSAPIPEVAPKPPCPVTLIAMGASTGGTEALATVLRELRPPLPPIVIVQHIPPMFSKLFADRLENECAIHVKEAESGDQLKPGWAYVAPGDKQMTVKRVGDAMVLDCIAGKKVNGHMPSVDVLFDSVAKNIGEAAMGVILTGMGEDGARGLLKMRQTGSVTLGQDEASSVVYGMPKAAFDMGAVTQQLPLRAIAGMMTRIAGY